jgi:homocitrate synthase NifV
MRVAREVRVVDTTLRDGHQSPGLALSTASRVRLARALDGVGVSRIAAGSPAMGQDEVEAIREVKDAVRTATVTTWNRLNLDDVRASLDAGPDVVHICLPVSERQMRAKLRLGWAKACSELEMALSLCREKGLQVSVGLEDITRAGGSHVGKVMDCLIGLGVKSVRLADTVGILTPLKTRELVGIFKEKGFEVEFHAHNDLGIADANSLVAAMSGADLIDTTLGGIGERAGNASLAGFLALAKGAPGIRVNVALDDALELEDTYLPALRREDYLHSLAASRGADITSFGALCQKRA